MNTDKMLKDAIKNYQAMLTNLSFSIIKDADYAKDCVSEVFTDFHFNSGKFENRSSLKTYLYKMTVNKSIDKLRKIIRERKKNEVIFSEASERTSDSELVITLRNALEKLETDYRIPLMLRSYQNFSYDEISEVLSIPIGTVRSRLFRAREQLCMILKSEGVSL